VQYYLLGRDVIKRILLFLVLVLVVVLLIAINNNNKECPTSILESTLTYPAVTPFTSLSLPGAKQTQKRAYISVPR